MGTVQSRLVWWLCDIKVMWMLLCQKPALYQLVFLSLYHTIYNIASGPLEKLLPKIAGKQSILDFEVSQNSNRCLLHLPPPPPQPPLENWPLQNVLTSQIMNIAGIAETIHTIRENTSLLYPPRTYLGKISPTAVTKLSTCTNCREKMKNHYQ